MNKVFFLIIPYLCFWWELKAQIWVDKSSSKFIENGSFAYPYHNFSFGLQNSLKPGINSLDFIVVPAPNDNLPYEMFDIFPEKYQITVSSSSK